MGALVVAHVSGHRSWRGSSGKVEARVHTSVAD